MEEELQSVLNAIYKHIGLVSDGELSALIRDPKGQNILQTSASVRKIILENAATGKFTEFQKCRIEVQRRILKDLHRKEAWMKTWIRKRRNKRRTNTNCGNVRRTRTYLQLRQLRKRVQDGNIQTKTFRQLRIELYFLPRQPNNNNANNDVQAAAAV